MPRPGATFPNGLLAAPGQSQAPPALLPGKRVLIWYDPADPEDVLVYGRQRRLPGVALLLTGAVFVTIGAVIGILAP